MCRTPAGSTAFKRQAERSTPIYIFMATPAGNLPIIGVQ
jgi:hypothetical protein